MSLLAKSCTCLKWYSQQQATLPERLGSELTYSYKGMQIIVHVGIHTQYQQPVYCGII